MNKIDLFKNNIKKKLYIFYKYIAYYLITQNIISIATIPIYSFWGLSFSLLSFIGNIIFMPFLIIFIFLSIILFFGFIFKITLTPLVFLLKKLTSLWFFLLINLGKRSLCIYFVHTNYCYLFCWTISFILITFYKLKVTLERWLLISTLSFILCVFTFKQIPPLKNIICLKKNNKLVIIQNTKKGVYIIDYANKIKNFNPNDNKWGLFNLIPSIAREYGHVSIKKYFFC